jgi:hypothetical protein
MANNCWNYVQIRSEKLSVLQELVSKFKNYGSFNTFVDFGDSFFKEPEKDKDYYFYGTKWWDMEIDTDEIELDDVQIQNKEYSITIQGDSAWGPPDTLIKMIALEYNVDVFHEYSEPGMNFGGILQVEDGLVSDEDYSYAEHLYRNCEGMHSLLNEYMCDWSILDCYDDVDAFIEEFPFVTDETEIQQFRDKWIELETNKKAYEAEHKIEK